MWKWGGHVRVHKRTNTLLSIFPLPYISGAASLDAVPLQSAPLHRQELLGETQVEVSL